MCSHFASPRRLDARHSVHSDVLYLTCMHVYNLIVWHVYNLLTCIMAVRVGAVDQTYDAGGVV
jgi:hypothetical protein